ncbi:MAG: ATP-dependent helicase, partial [Thiohalocapsa sp.]
FLSPPLVKVLYGKQAIGEVHQTTFIVKEDALSVLTLGGRSWQTKYIDWPRRTAYVEPTELRGRSQWLSSGQPLHFQLCQAVARVLAREDAPVAFSKRAAEFMETLREEHDWVEAGKTFLISYDDQSVVWWTFAGRLVNAAIAEALSGEASKVVSDNLSVGFTGAAGMASIKAAISILALDDFVGLAIPLDAEFIDELKFGECLPQSIRERELAARYDVSAEYKQIAGYAMHSILIRTE